MLHIGCHLSSSKGYRHMGEDALSIKADTFQFFTRNPRGSKAKKADPKDAEALRGLMEEHAFAPVLGHAPYTLNACALDEGLRAFARDAMRGDVMTLDTYLPHMLYNFHPGSHVGQGIDAGMALIVELLDAILRPEQTTRVLLETMSGKGTEVGSRFEELGHILRSVSLGDKMGVCLDTCHVWDAGYDIAGDLDGVVEEFDRVIGLDHGADDFVSKPFSMLELIARIRAVLRRAEPAQTSGDFSLGLLFVSPDRHEVKVGGKDVTLTNKEFELLCLLLRNKGIVLTRATLMDRVWGFESERENRTLDVHIRTLRVKLGEAGSYIETVRGIGYKIGGENA